MRSVYPEFACAKRRTNAVAIVEHHQLDDEGAGDDEEADLDIYEIEQFLADHDQSTGDDIECFEEADVAEALAVSWKEKRQELNKLQRARKFTQAKELTRSFQVEIQELKCKSRCNLCHQMGHWARECKNPPVKGQGKGASSSSIQRAIAMPLAELWWNMSLRLSACVPQCSTGFEPNEMR